MRPGIAVVRGEFLNPFEMQAYRPLAADFDVVLIGRRRPGYEVDALGLPTTLLPGTDDRRVRAAAARRIGKVVPHRAPGRLLGLDRAVAGRSILHAAETAIPTSEQCAAIAARTGAKLVLTCWENIPYRFDEDSAIAARKRRVRAACELFLAVTPSARSALLEEGTPEDKIVVVPAGVDVERFSPRAADPRLRRTLDVPEGAQVVVFVGRLIQEKGVVELVRAIARIRSPEVQPAHLVLAGSGPDGARALRAAEALGVADRVHLGEQVLYSQMPELFALADVVAVPSLPTPYWQEQFGMVLVEAMASGKPIVTTRSGSIPEVVAEAALLVEPYNVDALAEALGSVLGDRREGARLGAAARARAVETFSTAVVSEALADAYRRVLGT